MTKENENLQGIALEERVLVKTTAGEEIGANIAIYDKLIRERKYDEAERIERYIEGDDENNYNEEN